MQNFAEGEEELDHFALSSLEVKKGEKNLSKVMKLSMFKIV